MDGDRVEADRDGGLGWIPGPVDGGLPPFTELNSLAQGLGVCISVTADSGFLLLR